MDAVIKMPKVSVIVPVYNTELYVERAIISLMEQTLDNVQFVIIDDGSKDNSLNIIQEVIARYPAREGDVTLISRENLGVAATRAQGMGLATGDYIIHLDSDDWAEHDWLEVMYNKAISDNADVVVCDYQEIYRNKVISKRQHVPSIGFECVPKLIIGEISNANWNKLIKRSVFDLNEIKFNCDFRMGEDFLVSLAVFLNSSKVSYVCRALYSYNKANECSLTNVFDDKSLSDLINLVDKMIVLLDKHKLLDVKEITDAIIKFKVGVRNAYILQSARRSDLKIFALHLYPETNISIEHGNVPKFLKLTYFLNKKKMPWLFFFVDAALAFNRLLWRLNLK
ncbi:glycosyltransferase family 2 protein [Aeromonas rivipollensis]|uniref:glycosyltransferase family 2 protein n=1 Tax=Aeromonas rivipollensis TaxID=948519 RepID=UPI0038EB0179